MKKLVVINALVWSALILSSAYLFKNHHNVMIFLGIQLVLFSAVNGIMLKKQGTTKGC